MELLYTAMENGFWLLMKTSVKLLIPVLVLVITFKIFNHVMFGSDRRG